MNARHATSAIRGLIPTLALLALTTACTPDTPAELLEPELTVNTEQPTFTPFTVAPTLANTDEVVEALNDEYPTLLREAGIGGTANVWFLIGTDGRVANTILHDSSGLEPLDRAAMSVADVFRFSPAENEGVAVPVWVSLPITFQAS
ncbi:MAG: energy transducer TonB [Gemmatimonadota bacterium]|jgi:protein TonB